MFKLSCFFAVTALAIAVFYYSGESARFKLEAGALKERLSVQSALFEAERAKAKERQARYELEEAEQAAAASAARLRLRQELKKNNSCERELELIEEEIGKLVGSG